MLEELSRRLVNGGYEPDTPAALVYKATWPDEEAYICTVQELAATVLPHPTFGEGIGEAAQELCRRME